MSAKRRILFVTRAYHPDRTGGAAKSVRTLAEGLASRGYDVHILRLCKKGKKAELDSFYAKNNVTGISVHTLELKNIYWAYEGTKQPSWKKAVWHLIDQRNILMRKSIAAKIREIQPDIVNTNLIDGFSSIIFGEVKRNSSAKIIHTMRDYYLICIRSGMFKAGHACGTHCGTCRISMRIKQTQSSLVDLFLANSAYVRDQHIEARLLSAQAPCKIQFNASDIPITTYQRGTPVTVFGYIGRMDPTKGVDVLIEAVRRVKALGRRISVMIAGDGEPTYMKQLEASVKDLPEIALLGWQDAHTFYRKIHVLVCPSVYPEPLPRVIFEGYSCGVPVLASNTGGNPEVVREGKTGFLYSATDAAALASLIIRCADMDSDSYAYLSAEARHFAQNFTLDCVLDDYEAHFATVLSQDAKR
jgi:glycosyltransferase involved in cell wall biosynthesis